MKLRQPRAPVGVSVSRCEIFLPATPDRVRVSSSSSHSPRTASPQRCIRHSEHAGAPALHGIINSKRPMTDCSTDVTSESAMRRLAGPSARWDLAVATDLAAGRTGRNSHARRVLRPESFAAAAAEHLAQPFRGGDHRWRVQPAGLTGQSLDRPGNADRSDDLA